MKVKTVVVWWLVTGREHSGLTRRDKKIQSLRPLIAALFPGISYYSITGFSEVVHGCVVPALKRQFPDLMTVPSERVQLNATLEVVSALPSRGYEWQTSAAWKARFRHYLKAR